MPFRHVDGEIMNLPQRKLQRLKDYDYSKSNAYFVTLCTQNRMPLYETITDGILALNPAGLMISDCFQQLSQYGNKIKVDTFIVMPNHLHAILIISHINEDTKQVLKSSEESGTTRGSFPTVSEYIRRFKTFTTKNYISGVYTGDYPLFDKRIWQKSFHDHIIRSEQEFRSICQYIHSNPLKWAEDTYYQA